MEIFSTEKNIQEHLGLFFDSLKAGDIVLLSANLGMGKTTFVKKFLEHKKVLQAVEFSSPSYNLIQNYKVKDQEILHIDLYRLENEDQIESTGLWEVLEKDQSITFIEWPEKIDLKDLPERPIYQVEIISESLKAEDEKKSSDKQTSEDHQRLYRIKKLYPLSQNQPKSSASHP